MIGVNYAPDYDEWNDGYFGTVGELVGGHWLKVWITIAGAVSALGLLNSTMCTTSRALARYDSCEFFDYNECVIVWRRMVMFLKGSVDYTQSTVRLMRRYC